MHEMPFLASCLVTPDVAPWSDKMYIFCCFVLTIYTVAVATKTSLICLSSASMKLSTILAACLWTAGCLCKNQFFVPREPRVPKPSIVDDAADIGLRNVDASSSVDAVRSRKTAFETTDI